MPAYPEGNPGIHPVDPTTPVGQFRILYGDTSSDPYDPAVPGIQNYEELSDAEIETFLVSASGSLNRAIGSYYLYIAGEAAKSSFSIKDFDLQADYTKRAADLRAIAQMWLDRADGEDVSSAEEAFEIVPTGTGSEGFVGEGSLPVWGRRYTWDRWR